ncbi:uncharacterized protein V6R79_019401 [Siganus canaliculatus]
MQENCSHTSDPQADESMQENCSHTSDSQADESMQENCSHTSDPQADESMQEICSHTEPSGEERNFIHRTESRLHTKEDWFCPTGSVLLVLSHWFCPTGSVLLVLSHWFCPTGSVPVQDWFCPTGSVLLVLSYWFCPNGSVLLVLSYWFCPSTGLVLSYWFCPTGSVLLVLSQYRTGSVPLVLSYWFCPTGSVPVQDWFCPTGSVLLVLSYWFCPSTGLVLSHWFCPTGSVLMVLSYWFCPTGSVLLVLSYWFCPSAGLVLSYWFCPTGSVPLVLSYWFCPTGSVLLVLSQYRTGSVLLVLSYWFCPTGSVPVQDWFCPTGSVLLVLSCWFCPSTGLVLSHWRTGSVPVQDWFCPTGSVLLVLSYWFCPSAGLVLSYWFCPSAGLVLSYWFCPAGSVLLVLSQYRTGSVPLEDWFCPSTGLVLSYWFCLTGSVLLVLSQCRTGSVLLVLSCWFCPTGSVPVQDWFCPTGSVLLVLSQYRTGSVPLEDWFCLTDCVLLSVRLPCVTLTALVQLFLLSHGVRGAESGTLDLPWQDELCCDSPGVHLNSAQSQRCRLRSSTTPAAAPELPRGTCVDLLCRIDERWEEVACAMRAQRPEAAVLAVRLQRLLTHSGTDEAGPDPDPVFCEGQDSIVCAAPLHPTAASITMVTVSISDAAAPPVLLRVPARPEKPGPPVNLSHIQTIQAELVLLWDDPSDPVPGPLRHQVRYSPNSSHPDWQVLSVAAETRLSLDLKAKLNYSVQVRCSVPTEPPLWSDWSRPHHIYLDTVSYIPEKVVVRPGENVTVHCVFNDHSINASMAVWMLNFEERLHRSQYQPVHQWVSRITVRPSDTRLYDLLQCTQEWTIPYSQIYVDGASIDIRCETNGDIDAMECSWKNTQWTKPKFRSRWADQPCDVMEDRDRAGEEVGDVGPGCLQVRSRQRSCIIQPLRMNCYKLWLEVPSRLGPVRSRPVYLSPVDHVKPHPPTNVKALSRSSGVLAISWDPPTLPVDGLHCQSRYHTPSALRVPPDWKVQAPVQLSWAEVSVPDMCRVYVVEVRCIPAHGTGYWSEWSEPVYSTPENSRAPERGPDFWRILQDEPDRNRTNVTLLFKPLPPSAASYCVDGFIVRRQASGGSVTTERLELTSSHSFQWNQQPQTITVEAYNGLGSSSNNFNMTLEQQHKRRCLGSFSVTLVNSSCVSLVWSLMDNCSVPVSMVVYWGPQRPHRGPTGAGWARLAPRGGPTLLTGDFFSSGDVGFHLVPVFADGGEGQPLFARASRSDPAAFLMLSIISFLSVVLVVTLLLSQNQMKKFVWKDVPNPNQCSWARGLDLNKADAWTRLFRPPDGLPAWPLAPPSEDLSTVVIVDKTPALVQVPLVSLTPVSAPDAMQAPASEDLAPDGGDSSGQSSVTYATVLLPDAKQEPGGSSSDEGNFSANNSDISGSFPGGLWEPDDPRRSCSYNSVEELSEDEEEARGPEDYLGTDYLAEDEDSEEEEEQGEEEAKGELLKGSSREARPLLAAEASAPSALGLSALYLPQFRTASCPRPQL